MHAGPAAEPRMLPKRMLSGALLVLPALLVCRVFDHRSGWSSGPAAVSGLGDALLMLGLGIAMLVVIPKSDSAANVTVEADQNVISTGLCGLVRHPGYGGTHRYPSGARLLVGPCPPSTWRGRTCAAHS